MIINYFIIIITTSVLVKDLPAADMDHPPKPPWLSGVLF